MFILLLSFSITSWAQGLLLWSEQWEPLWKCADKPCHPAGVLLHTWSWMGWQLWGASLPCQWHRWMSCFILKFLAFWINHLKITNFDIKFAHPSWPAGGSFSFILQLLPKGNQCRSCLYSCSSSHLFKWSQLIFLHKSLKKLQPCSKILNIQLFWWL